MRKKKILIFVILVLLTFFVIGVLLVQNAPNAMAIYEGKWKVTQQLTEYTKARMTFFSQHYLGRTVILGETFMEKSISEWPYYLDWMKEEYDFSEVVWINKNDPWIQGNVAEDFEEFVESEEVQFIRYFNMGTDKNVYCANKLIVLDNTHLAYSFIGGYFLLEPFQHCDPETDSSDLLGNWEIIYLDSYEESYEGGFEEIEELKKYGNAMRQQMSILTGTDFAVDEWLGKTVDISEETLSISESSFQINKVEESRVSRENFEKEKGIHDGLSIYNDEINVCNIKCDNGEEVICVLINKDRMIIHIEQGWFMLARKQE